MKVLVFLLMAGFAVVKIPRLDKKERFIYICTMALAVLSCLAWVLR